MHTVVIDADTKWNRIKLWRYVVELLVCRWHLGWCRDSYLPHRRGFSTFLGIHHNRADHFDYTLKVKSVATTNIEMAFFKKNFYFLLQA